MSASPAPTTTESGRHSELVATVVGLDRNVNTFAREAANDQLHEEMAGGGRLKRFGKRIWQGNLARDYYLQKYTRQARGQILDSQQLYAHENVEDVAATDGAMRQAVTERFVSDYEGMVREGENKQELEDNGEQGELKATIRGLIGRYASGELDDTTFGEEKLRVLQAAAGREGADNYIGNGNLFADNLLEVARQVRARVDQDQGEAGIQALLDNIRVIGGEANVGANTEVKRTAADRIIEKLSGHFVNETTIGTAAAVAMSLAKWGSRTVLGTAAKLLAPGASTAVVAGVREHFRFREERSLTARDAALGRESGGGARREQLERAVYESRPSVEITDSLRAMMSEDDPYALRDDFDRDDFEAAMSLLGDSFARVQTGDRENMDFITFSSVATSEVERTAMLDQMNLSRAFVRQWFEAQPEDVRRELAGDEGNDFDGLVTSYKGAASHELRGDVEIKDALFKKMSRAHVAKAAAIGAAAGLVIGVGVQEVEAMFEGGTQGFIEQMWQHAPAGHTEHQTFLDGVLRHQSGGTSYEVVDLTGHTQVVGPNNTPGQLSLDSAFHVSHGTDGLDITTPGGSHINNINFDSHGILTPDSQKLLENNHFSFVDHTHVIETHQAEDVSLPTNEFVAHHPGDFTNVTRDGWFDNNTPRPDLNELKTWWGDGGVGVDAQGNYSFDISHMTPDGSYHDGLSANWQQLAEAGKLKMAISFSEGSQQHALMLNIGTDGKITIPHDSLASHAFSTENGHAVFEGKYAEVSEITKVDPNGLHHIMPLSTVVGEGNVSHLHDVIQVPHSAIHHEYELAYHQPEAISSPDILAPPSIPITGREALSPWRRRAQESYSYRYGELSPEGIVRLQREVSPRLLENPNADLNPAEELRDYRERLERERGFGAGYVRQIDEVIESTPELRDISPDVKAIITIPVRADGVAESEGLYGTLRLYAEQGPEALKQSTILLHVNWFDDVTTDPDAKARIDATKAAIERARLDFPDLSIAAIETEWKRAEIKGGVIGHVARKMTDTALLALERSMREGRRIEDNDAIIIRNDADAKGISRGYLRRMIDSADKNDRTDIFTGTTRFDNRKATELPGMVFAVNFARSIDLISSARENNARTGGANFGVRAGTMAAIGGIGFDTDDNGAGSDDINIGRRIMAVRRGAASGYPHGIRGYYDRLRGRRKGYKASSASGVADGGARRVGVRVIGAQVDTDSDRSEELWRAGIPVMHTWTPGKAKFDFDEGGHSDRSSGLDKSVGSEDLRSDPDAVIERIRKDMEETISQEGGPSAIVDTALAFIFSDLPQGQVRDQAYKLTYKTDRVSFVLTDIGRKYILQRLTRDSRGRFDPYGSRKARQLYGQVKPGAKRRPVGRPLVSAA